MTDKQAKDLAAEQERLTKEAAEAAAVNDAVEGGKYLAEDGKTLVNANGEPIRGASK